MIEGIAERGVLGTCTAVLSGYLGSADIGQAVLGAVARVRAANPDAVYCCDPVIGDVGRGVFVRPGIEELLRDVVLPLADVLTPNHFELDLLAGTTTTHPGRGQGRRRRAAGARPGHGADHLAGHRRDPRRRRGPARLAGRPALAGPHARSWACRSTARATRPRRCSWPTGCASAPPPTALAAATASVCGLLAATEAAGSREILLVAAQDELVGPSRVFEVTEV